MSYWKSWRYKNITLSFFGLIAAIFVSQQENFHTLLLQSGNLGNLGYLGAFLAGMFFVSTFTVAISAVVLLVLAQTLSLLELGIFASLGAVVGDFTIFHLIKDNMSGEIGDLYNRFDSKHHLINLFHSKYFSWTLPVLGAIIIASPFPDEVGISLLGLSKMKSYQFLVISLILNSIGIFLILSTSSFIKP